MKKIYIKEEKLSLFLNEEKEVTFYEFFINAKSFLKDLLKKPHEAEPSELFKKHGISKSDLIHRMKDVGLLKSNERIDEVPVSEGKKTHPYGTKLVAKHYVKYSIPRNRFEEKMKVLYKELFTETYDNWMSACPNIIGVQNQMCANSLANDFSERIANAVNSKKDSYKPQVFKDSDKLITDMLDMDVDGAYKNRGGYDKDVVEEDGAAGAGGATSCGNVMQGGRN